MSTFAALTEWRRAPLWLAGVSLALLGGAFAFQYLGGLAPCPLCHWQRYPHAAAIVLALGAFALPGRAGIVLLALAALALLTTAGIGAFHVGVEQRWWAGLDTCEAATGTVDPKKLLEDVRMGPRCDEVAWSLLGISMAGYNALISGAAGLLGLVAAAKLARRPA